MSLMPALNKHAAIGLLLALAGCASLAPKPPAPPPAPTPEALAAEQQARQLAGFEAQQRALAEEAETRGLWAQSAWAWEALLAVRPADEAVAARLQRALKAAESLATLRAQQARLALQLGDTGSARDLYIRALAAQPTHAEAIDGLRTLERERVRTQQQAQARGPASPATLQRSGRPVRAELEHATLLAAQGELQAAITLLQPLAAARPVDAAARRSLSQLLLRQAEAQRASDPAQALASLQRSVQMDSGNTRAATLLRDWRRPAAAAAPAAGRPPPAAARTAPKTAP